MREEFDFSKYNVIFKEDFVIGYSDDLVRLEKDYIGYLVDNYEDDYENDIGELAFLIKELKRRDSAYVDYNAHKLYKIRECQMGGFCIEEVEID